MEGPEGVGGLGDAVSYRRRVVVVFGENSSQVLELGDFGNAVAVDSDGLRRGRLRRGPRRWWLWHGSVLGGPWGMLCGFWCRWRSECG